MLDRPHLSLFSLTFSVSILICAYVALVFNVVNKLFYLSPNVTPSSVLYMPGCRKQTICIYK